MSGQAHAIVLGAGPMGRAIAAALVAQGQRVTVVTRDGRPMGPGIASAKADLARADQTIAACQGGDTIFQCAAPPYHAWAEAFAPLQDAAIAAAAATGAVLVAVENLYGYGVAGTLSEDAALAATTRKGAVRAQLSKALLAAHAAGRARTVAGRATDFFGPAVHMAALGERFWTPLLTGKTLDWVGDPDVLHSFAYLPDLATAYIALAQTPAAHGRAWHLPALPPISLRDVVAKARAAGAPPARIRQTPSWLLRAIGLFQPAAGELVEMRYMFDAPFIIDHSRFDREIGGGIAGWDTALAETGAWWQQEIDQAKR
ncbi:MAG: NAD-dependent epimerase/dehydratase family protein [Pseudomonadota bacterium]